jgi:hypothetical protein
VREATPPFQTQHPTGEEDVARVADFQSSLLVIRRLKPSTNRQVLIKGLNKKLCRDGNESEDELGAHPESLRAVYFICDTQTDQSLTYAFVEFHSAADAKSALRKAEVLGDQCTVSSQRFTVDFADSNAFPISDNQSSSDFVVQFRDDVRRQLQRKYRDHRYYASYESVNEALPQGYELPPLEDSTPAADLKTSGPPPAAESQSVKKRTKEAQLTDRFGEPKAKKAKAESTLPGQFATWTRKQAELRAEEAMEIDEASTNIDARQSFIVLTKISAAEEADKENSSLTESAEGNLHAICFLCATTFPQTNAISHVSQSNLHRQRLEDTRMLDDAYALMKSLGIEPEQMLKVQVDFAGDGEDYLDRAKLRREVEKQRRRELKAQAKSAPKIKMSLGGNALDDDHGEPCLHHHITVHTKRLLTINVQMVLRPESAQVCSRSTAGAKVKAWAQEMGGRHPLSRTCMLRA